MYSCPCSKVSLTVFFRTLLKFATESSAKHSTSGQKLSWFYVLLDQWPISQDSKVGSEFDGNLRKEK